MKQRPTGETMRINNFAHRIELHNYYYVINLRNEVL
jgi:hypothetical protein